MLQGVGSIMGGIIIMQAGKGKVEYIFTEKNFGHIAPNEEVEIQMMQSSHQHQGLLTCITDCFCRFLRLVDQ